MNLADHLQAAAAEPFTWGHSDCCLFPADWMKARTGIDPAAPLRGRYGTAFGALRHITARGGFVQMVRDLMRDAGFAETDSPVPGDVGIVMQPTGPVLAIKTPLGWAGKAPEGIVAGPFKHLAAWTIPESTP